MEKRMGDDATARAMTGGTVLVLGTDETNDGIGVDRGTVVIGIATGETVTVTDGAREIGNGAPAETDNMTDEVSTLSPLLGYMTWEMFFNNLQDTQPKVTGCVNVPALLSEKALGTDREAPPHEDPGQTVGMSVAIPAYSRTEPLIQESRRRMRWTWTRAPLTRMMSMRPCGNTWASAVSGARRTLKCLETTSMVCARRRRRSTDST